MLFLFDNMKMYNFDDYVGLVLNEIFFDVSYGEDNLLDMRGFVVMCKVVGFIYVYDMFFY